MAGKIQQLSEFVVIRSLKRFRDTYFPNSGKVDKTPVKDTGEEEPRPGFLDSLPVRQSRVIRGDILLYYLKKDWKMKSHFLKTSCIHHIHHCRKKLNVCTRSTLLCRLTNVKKRFSHYKRVKLPDVIQSDGKKKHILFQSDQCIQEHFVLDHTWYFLPLHFIWWLTPDSVITQITVSFLNFHFE